MFFERETGGERAIICSVTIREPNYLPDVDEFFPLLPQLALRLLER